MPGGQGHVQDYYASLSSEGRFAQSSRGGLKSAEVRREKKLLRDYLSTLLEAGEKGATNYDRITIALVEKAMEGDVSAYKEIRATLGQDAPQQIEMSAKDSINIVIDGTEVNK